LHLKVKFSRYLPLFWCHFFHIFHSFGVSISKFSHRIGGNYPKIPLFWHQQFQKFHYFGINKFQNEYRILVTCKMQNIWKWWREKCGIFWNDAAKNVKYLVMMTRKQWIIWKYWLQNSGNYRGKLWTRRTYFFISSDLEDKLKI